MSEQPAAPANRPIPLLVPASQSGLSDFVSIAEAATGLGVSRRTIQRAVQRGELVAVKQGRAVLVSTTAIADFADRRQNGAAAPPLARPLLHLVDLSLADLEELADLPLTTPDEQPEPIPLAAPARLPSPLTSFVGRSADTAAVTALLTRPDVRLVTLTGVGGVGKTRLALRAADTAGDHFADGVVFVPLAAVGDPALVLPAIARALGLRDEAPDAPAERLRQVIQTRRLLLILDNFEHLAEAGPTIVDLLAACPRLTVLVTSRTLLRVSGECPFAVRPMLLAEMAGGAAGAGSSSVDELGQVESIQLFVARARAARTDFVLTPERAPTIAAICARLEGLPLAIELAAARCAVLTPAALLARLDQRLTLLTGGPRDQPDRLRTMRDAIAWSYDLLPPAAQALFRRLSVFTGGISLEAAEAMARLPATAAASVHPAANVRSLAAGAGPSPIDLLASLVDGTLLQPVEAANGDQRYLMLETVREFAFEQLVGMGEEGLARACHGAHFLTLAEEAQPELAVTSSETMLDRLDLEHANLRGALTWSIAADPGLALRLSSYLGPFWNKRGYWSEGREWLERALEAGPTHPSRERAIALGNAGALAGELRETSDAKRLLTESSAIADELDDADIAARARRGLGIIASDDGDLAAAATLFTAALERYRTQGRQAAIARCLTDLGLVAARDGDLGRAIAAYEEALPAARGAGDQWQVCVVLGNLGEAYADHGDLVRAEVIQEEALALSRQLGDTYGVAMSLFGLGNIANAREQAIAALGRYQELIPFARQLGERSLLTRALDRVGLALHQLGVNRPAARLFGASAAMREATGDILYASEAADYSQIWQLVRSALGETLYEAAWASGRSLPLDQALAEAVVVAQSAVMAATPPALPSRNDAGLTKRETEVLRLIAAGRSDREIADTIFVARTTASKHVSAILDKLEAGSRTEAVAIALRDRML
ncbi:MAG: tetratricopeptide repeat protein [Chloroflexota bacterium]|nr:tetratricopeptide repeat protein [Chloroflexota bacterium]